MLEQIATDILNTVLSWTENKQKRFWKYASSYISEWYPNLTLIEINKVYDFLISK